ncbi:MAG: YggT family protein [Armatimonadetes bacterium]|nr:YggT family protein [Armatimonadota bacterium]
MSSLIQLVNLAFWALRVLILAGVILSWIHFAVRRPPGWVYSRWALWIDDTSRAILRPFRNLLRRGGVNLGSIDISPILALVAIEIAQWLVRSLLLSGLR